MDDRIITVYRNRLKQLEIKIKTSESKIEDLFELTFLYMLFHQDDDAIKVLENILKIDSRNIMAKIWLTDLLCMHPLVDDFKSRIYSLAQEIIESTGELSSAGYNLINWANQTGVTGKYDENETINLLKKAIDIAPNWPGYHRLLSYAYAEAKKYTEALDEAEKALSLMISKDPNWSLQEEYFEEFITGRYISDANLSRLKQHIAKLKAILKSH